MRLSENHPMTRTTWLRCPPKVKDALSGDTPLPARTRQFATTWNGAARQPAKRKEAPPNPARGLSRNVDPCRGAGEPGQHSVRIRRPTRSYQPLDLQGDRGSPSYPRGQLRHQADCMQTRGHHLHPAVPEHNRRRGKRGNYAIAPGLGLGLEHSSFGQYAFSSFLMGVEVQRQSSFNSGIDALRTWPDQSWNYSLKIFWKSDESSIEINVNLAKNNWSASSRAKLDTWKIVNETDAEFVIAAADSTRLEECRNFFASQLAPTFSPWWRYVNPIHQNQIVVQDLPFLTEDSELLQYHQKSYEKNLLIVLVVYLDHYLTPIEYEVFEMRNLFKRVETSRDACNDAFTRSYQFTLDSTDTVLHQRRGSDSYFVRLQIQPWMSNGDVLPFASRIGTDVIIRIHDCYFSGRILSVERYVLIMKIKRTIGTAALILNEQHDYFRFGNLDAPFVIVRPTTRDVMWERVSILEDNWPKRIWQAHENLTMQR